MSPGDDSTRQNRQPIQWYRPKWFGHKLDMHDIGSYPQEGVDRFRIAYGNETTKRLDDGTMYYVAREADCCPDCQVEQGEKHEDGCDVEQCPKCGHQLISCDHGEEFLGGWHLAGLDTESGSHLDRCTFYHDEPPRIDEEGEDEW